MSIDINWESLTTGPDGSTLSESIRDYIHDKFQTIPLPRFIKSVVVHEFSFGAISPEVEIIDICDPLPDFYEELDGEDYGEDGGDDDGDKALKKSLGDRADDAPGRRKDLEGEADAQRDDSSKLSKGSNSASSANTTSDLRSSFFGVYTPGISGGTSNLNYFHSQLATGLSGTQTPLAAVAGAHLPNAWAEHAFTSIAAGRGHFQTPSGHSITPPQTASSDSSTAPGQQPKTATSSAMVDTLQNSVAEGNEQEDNAIQSQDHKHIVPPRRFREPRIEDLQTVFRVRYAGDVKLSLTAEILLDYPMPSFVGIPVKLKITGLAFDGVAVLAYIRKRAHFCFLNPEDASTAIGSDTADRQEDSKGTAMGGLLSEIKVESEIGKRENGKQVLKNVGKVEKFVLEQVRRIFEDEFVYPSFWTFLV